MSVNRASTIFRIASLKTQWLSLQRGLIIELLPAFLGTTLLWQHHDYVLKITVNEASTTFGLASSKIQGLHGDINPWSNYWPPLYAKMFATTSLLCPKNERQRSVNDFRPCILENATVVRRHWPTIELLASFLGKYAYNIIVTMSRNERQQSVKEASTIFDLASCII
jgi:hypothetical protein